MKTLNVQSWPTLAAYVAEARTSAVTGSNGHSWDAGVSGPEAVRRATQGDPTVASQAAGLMLAARAMNEAPVPAWKRDVRGSRVNVGEYMTGAPDCMRRRVKSPGMGQSARIVVSLGVSAWVSAEKVLQRGALVLALVESLQLRNVQVSLTLVHDGECKYEDFFQVIDIETSPLDVSTAGFALVHPSFVRNIMFRHADTHGWQGKGSGRWNAERTNNTGDFLRVALGLADTDIVVPPFRDANDTQTKMLDRPGEWLREKLANYE